MSGKIFVLSPNARATGGVELLHQFVSEVNKFSDLARVVYFPFSAGHEKPGAYEKYNCPAASISEVDVIGSIVVIPETLTHLVRRFRHASVFVWWLSVDNYFGSQKLRFLVANRLMPFSHWRVRPGSSVRHLAQSQYAVDFLASHGVNDARLLTDYLNPDFIKAAQRVDFSKKQDIVLYNPAKGLDRTSQILAKLPQRVRAVPLQGMTREEMVDTLGKAKVYIDFGNHPGKDRIPREAAIMGCCVVTNLRGSARNDCDVPLEGVYKIDDTSEAFAQQGAQTVMSLVDGFSAHIDRYQPYRAMIAEEHSVFASQVRGFVADVVGG